MYNHILYQIYHLYLTRLLCLSSLTSTYIYYFLNNIVKANFNKRVSLLNELAIYYFFNWFPIKNPYYRLVSPIQTATRHRSSRTLTADFNICFDTLAYQEYIWSTCLYIQYLCTVEAYR